MSETTPTVDRRTRKELLSALVRAEYERDTALKSAMRAYDERDKQRELRELSEIPIALVAMLAVVLVVIAAWFFL